MIRIARTASAALALLLLALPAPAQVPQDFAYQGRLTDAVGASLAGPVDLTFAIYDVPTGGTPLYEEEHLAVPLDDNGAFSIQVGTGTSKVGDVNPGLFSGMNRYLEVVVDGEVLAPRQPFASVPYALVAEEVVASPTSTIGALQASVADHEGRIV